MAMMNLATLCRTASTRFLPQECHVTKKDLIQGINTPKYKGTDHIPIMVLDIGDISAGHSPAAIPTAIEAAVLEGTPHAPLSSATAACTTLQLIDTPSPLTMRHQHSYTPSHNHHFSCRHHSHHSTDWSKSCISKSHHTAHEPHPRKAKQCPRPSTPINLTIQRLSPSRIPL